MDTPSSPCGEACIRCIVLSGYISAEDAHQRALAAEFIGYLLAYAEQTDTVMRALHNHSAPGAYKFVFCFKTRDGEFDFLRLLQLNHVTARSGQELSSAESSEIADARPISHVLPMDLVPRILAFADALLGRSIRDSWL